MKTVLFFVSLLLTGLSAGLFFAWSVSVILGTKKLGDYTYLETMQSINREILNPIFLIVFFGSFIALVTNSFFQFNKEPQFWLVLAATLVYLIGTLGITGFGNVPLNYELDILDLSQLSNVELKSFRMYYESNWNQYHNIRTFSAMTSFILLLIAVFIQKTI